ncbi:unnamed protein product, partial [Meganyctiphanes norvegica]
QHQTFAHRLLSEISDLEDSGDIVNKAANFIAQVHESFCHSLNNKSSAEVSVVQETNTTKTIPSVAAMADVVNIFADLLQQRKQHVQKKLGNLQCAMDRVSQMENTAAGLR